MRALKYLGLAVLFPALMYAGQIYGSVTSEGRGVAAKDIEITCKGAPPATGTTAADGSYRIHVLQQGQCTFTLPQYPGASATVFSTPSPSAYNFALIAHANGAYELRRR